RMQQFNQFIYAMAFHCRFTFCFPAPWGAVCALLSLKNSRVYRHSTRSGAKMQLSAVKLPLYAAKDNAIIMYLNISILESSAKMKPEFSEQRRWQ
ncbi:MAG: hypothetical protein ACRCT0_09075, partial [Plesiomonas shigelloides]